MNAATVTEDAMRGDAITKTAAVWGTAIGFAGEADPSQNVEFINVTCALDRFSSIMTPVGKVRIYVDGMLDQTATGGVRCRRYAGDASTTATTQFPSTALPIPLRAVGGCP
jgi:hypothetical protein